MRISCVGGSAVWRRGMRSILEEGGFEAVELDGLSAWEPGLGGVAALLAVSSELDSSSLADFREDFPHIPVVAVLPDMTLTSMAAAIRAGASAAIDEADTPERVLAVLRSAMEGTTQIPFRIARAMAELVPSASEAAHLLSSDEIDWLRAMSQGETVAELSERVGYSERAMFRNLRGVYARIGAKNRTEALIWASRAGLLGDSFDG